MRAPAFALALLFGRPTGDPMGESYGPGEARRRILDLSLLDGLPPPGSYTLRITFNPSRKGMRGVRIAVEQALTG